MSLPELPEPDLFWLDRVDVGIRAKFAHSAEQMHVHAALAVEMYRQKLRAEFAKRHAEIKHHHNYYGCLVREIDDGVL